MPTYAASNERASWKQTVKARHGNKLRPAYRATLLAICIALLGMIGIFSPPTAAQTGPFAALPGNWSGTGKIRVKSGETLTNERIRCTATYRLRGNYNIDLRLGCTSDSYKFDLTGEFEADETGRFSGRWTEHSRNVGGTAIGTVRGDTLQVHVESSAFAADLQLVTRGQRQTISLDSHGAGQIVTASIALQRT